MSPEANANIVRIIHFNDVYNVEPRTTEPVGGAARFKSAILSLLTDSCLVLFSGDCVAPSISKFDLIVTLCTQNCLPFSVSTFTQGEQMIPVLNQCKVDCAVLGNHDFGK